MLSYTNYCLRCGSALLIERWTNKRKCPNRCKRYRRRKSLFETLHPEMYDRKLMRFLRDQLKTIYGSVCMKCGDKRRICVEHILSRAIGGSNELTNLQLLCWPCNSEKGLDVVDYRPDNWVSLLNEYCQLTASPYRKAKKKSATPKKAPRKNKK